MKSKSITAEALAQATSFSPTIPFPSIDDRAFWEGLSADARTALLRAGEEALAGEIPQLFLSDYTAFSTNGNRSDFEGKYFRRRTMLATLVLATCAAKDEVLQTRFLLRIVDLIWAILEESTWCLPAHNTYVRDTPALPVPDVTRPVIDLFAAETAALLGLTEQLLRSRLAAGDGVVSRPIDADGTEGMVQEGVSPISDRIDGAIEQRILRPYLSYHFWWMGDGEQPMCNWTPWITQNILLTLFTRRAERFSEKDLRRVLAQAARSVDYYLDDYGEDGCCNEGAFYYGHSGLCLFGCYDLMNRITGDGMQAVWQAPLVKNIAAYIVRMYVGNGIYFNYSDASPFPGHRSARDFLFAKSTGNEAYASFAAADFRSLSTQERLLCDEQNLYYHLLQLACWREMEAHPVSVARPKDAFFESVGLLVARDARWTFAVKAGDNGDSHNHNDVGSVTLYLDAKPFLIDLGVETYTAKTFSDRRYEIWTMQSAYHNTVNFAVPAGGADAGVVSADDAADDLPLVMQRDGKHFAARDVQYVLDDTEATLTMELADVYGDPRVRSVRRRAALEKGSGTDADIASSDGRLAVPGRVVLRDEIDSDLPGVLVFMTYEKPEIVQETGADGSTEISTEVGASGGAADAQTVLLRIGALGTLRASGIARAVIEVCPITDARLAAAWKHDCYRILLVMAGSAAGVVIEAGGIPVR